MKKCLLMFSFLVLMGVGTVNAANSLFWSGEVAFPVSVTNVDTKDGIVFYFYKYNPTLAGTWYVDPNKELLPAQVGSQFQSPSPCLAGFISDDGANEIWIYDGAYLLTENPKSKNERFFFVGTGIFLDHDAKVSAVAYINASGWHKQDELGKTQSIKMIAKVGAGMQANETWPAGFFVLNGQFSGTFYRQEE
jgi:hypothetical protein